MSRCCRSLFVGDERCTPREAPTAQPAPKGWAHFQWRVDCAASGPATIESLVLLAEAPSHMHFARVEGEPGAILERVLTEGDPRWDVPVPDAPGAPSAAGTSLAGYVSLGVEHILTGWDHLAFVIALLLLAGTLSEVAALVGYSDAGNLYRTFRRITGSTPRDYRDPRGHGVQ